ncbi:MAG: choice-of-anchor M domain-containing protein [Opitutales bacterium]
MKDFYHHFWFAELLLIASVSSLSAQVLLEDHTDITFSFTGDVWEAELRHGGTDDNPDTSTPLDQASLPASDTPSSAGNRYTQPDLDSFDFTGVADGEPLWIFPQSDFGYDYTWPGFRTDHIPGTFLAYNPSDPRVTTVPQPWVTIKLVGMDYVGASNDPQFSLFQDQNGAILWMATSDGIDASDVFLMPENEHTHLSFAFSSLGLYRIAFQPSARLTETLTVEGKPQWVSFAIGTKATWTASHYSGEDLFTESVSGDASDSDQDGIRLLLEYAFNLNPVVADVKILEPTTGTSGLPLTRLMPDGANTALEIEYIRRKASTNPQISYFAEFKDDLGTGEWTVQTAETVTSIDDTWERVIVDDSVDTSVSNQRFGRVRIEVQDSIIY